METKTLIVFILVFILPCAGLFGGEPAKLDALRNEARIRLEPHLKELKKPKEKLS